MRHLKALSAIFLVALLTGCNCKQQASSPKYGTLSVVGTQLVGDDGQPAILRGVSYGWHNWHSRFYNEESVQWLKYDWNCSVVRASMGVEPKGGYLTDRDSAVANVQAVVNGAIKAGIYVIIDWHSHGIHTNEAKQFFGTMAEKYGNCPNIIWEIFNEPMYQSWKDVKEYSMQVIDTIRVHSDNVILVGNPHWDQDINLVADDAIQGYSNIMYTVHFYASTHKQWLRDRCDSALSKNIPIFISESACCEASGDGTIDLDEWNTWIDWCENNNISWVIWSVTDKKETCSMLFPSASSFGQWQDADLSESGKLTREKIRNLNY